MHIQKKRKARTYVIITLVLLLFFLSTGGFYGGILLTVDPSGNSLQVPQGLLDHLPIHSYLIPGLFLNVFFGILPLLAVFGLIFGRKLLFLNKINPVKRWKWPVTLSFFIGCTLFFWTVGELILWETNMLSVIYLMLGVLIMLFALLTVREV